MMRKMASKSKRSGEPAHDVLAAEEFVMPAPDPKLHHEAAHDVLAAEEFVVPAADRSLLYRGPVQLPDDPTGIAEAHDVLAAEEFALPAPPVGVAERPQGVGSADRRILVAAGVLTLVALRLLRRRRA
jgi:hypothetical protein